MTLLLTLLLQLSPIQRVGPSCPLGYYRSGGYCLPTSSPIQRREAVPLYGPTCPLGWYRSSSYCVRSRY